MLAFPINRMEKDSWLLFALHGGLWLSAFFWLYALHQTQTEVRGEQVWSLWGVGGRAVKLPGQGLLLTL